jgi:hypothetical protein
MDKEYIFKLRIDVTSPVPRTITRNFKSLKSMRQWQQRKDIENNIYMLAYREYTINEQTKKWERFIVFGKSVVLFSELEREYQRLKRHEEL